MLSIRRAEERDTEGVLRLLSQVLEVQGNRTEQARTATPYKLVTFNTGFGAYEPDYSFFMDGGTQSWAWSKERLLKNMAAIQDFLKAQDADFYFLQEVDEQTGLATTLEPRFSIWGAREKDESGDSALVNAGNVQTVHAFRETNVGATVFNLLAGVLIGAAAIWFLFMPARTKAIRDEANQKIASYSSNMAVDEAQVAALRAEIEQSQETVDTANARIDEANTKATTYENLIKAVNAFNNGAVFRYRRGYARLPQAARTRFVYQDVR